MVGVWITIDSLTKLQTGQFAIVALILWKIMEGSYMDGASVGLFGTWKIADNKIVIETRLFPETMSEDEFIYETLSLRDIKFADENNVLGISMPHEKTRRLASRSN